MNINHTSTFRWCAAAILAAAAFLSAFTARADGGRGLHKKIYAVPNVKQVKIDGKLDDWDLSGQLAHQVTPCQ